MISLDLAQKLRDAGLEWEPCQFDTLFRYEVLSGSPRAEVLKTDTWLPRLDQILIEIEQRGYKYTFWNHSDPTICYSIGITKGSNTIPVKRWTADTPIEAAGQALLWILREG
jgi:hypothetical protein